MASTIELAAALQARGDDELEALLAARPVPLTAASWFDLAEHLIAPASIARALETIEADGLRTLADGRSSAHHDALALGIDGQALPEVRREVGVVPPASEEQPVAATSGEHAAERAFTFVVRVASVLSSLGERPIELLQRGGMPMHDARRLAERIDAQLADIGPLVATTTAAGLVRQQAGTLLATKEAEAWMHEATAERWARLAEAWLASLPAHERTIATAPTRSRDALLARYPRARAAVLDRLEDVQRTATALGLVDGAPTPLVEGGAAWLARVIPGDIEHVYVQPDLSIVAPGPLAPVLDARLRDIADLEQRAIAATYRLSRESVTRALAHGESAESILELLESLSLTGVPQPVAYLVREAAASFGALRVHELEHAEAGARSAIRSNDDALLRAIAVDRGLAALGLTPAGARRVLARPAAEIVVRALVAERYPAVLEDADGRVVPRARHVADEAPPASSSPLIARLRGTAFDVRQQEHAWLERSLQTAIRERAIVTVRFEMQGAEHEVSLVPLGLAAGRLRGKDPASDVERTLPVRAITSISGAP